MPTWCRPVGRMASITCPICGTPDPNYLTKQRRFECKTKHARRQFSVKVGTVMEDSPIALKSWLLAIWMVSNCKNGVSSYEMHRALGITQKSAWFLLHRVRLAMQDKTTRGNKITGEVEVDETYIGGKARNMHSAKRKALVKGGRGVVGKVAVMGLLERHSADKSSRIRTAVVQNTKRHRLHAEIEKNVEDGTTVYTDSHPSYQNLDLYYQHKVIDHAEKYVDGQVHTNGCENFWSLLKRAIKGTYVNVEPFHLFRYLDEQAFRFNERTGKDGDRFQQVLAQVKGRRVMYKTLIGRPADL